MGIAARAANKTEKYPKEGMEDPKSEQKKKVHSRRAPVLVVAGLLLLPVV